jgi:thioredoxin 1
MLVTNLAHVENKKQFDELLKDNKNVMICCGRMGPMCIPVYKVMARLQPQYAHVQFRDMDFDTPVAMAIRGLSQCASFMGLPFTVYFRDGKVVRATSSIQNEKQIVSILDDIFIK